MHDLTIVFDLDGTLVDTAPDLMRCTNYALGLAGLAPVPYEVLRPIISYGAKAMIERGLSVHGKQLTADEIDRLWKRFIDHYVATISQESRPFPGLLAVLDHLEASGARLAVCTNKLAGMSRQLLDELGMSQRFRTLAGRDTFPFCKPHPAHLLRTIEQAGGTPDARHHGRRQRRRSGHRARRRHSHDRRQLRLLRPARRHARAGRPHRPLRRFSRRVATNSAVSRIQDRHLE